MIPIQRRDPTIVCAKKAISGRWTETAALVRLPTLFFPIELHVNWIFVDIDECVGAAREENVCADVTTTCRNTNGSYECACIPGYVKNNDAVNESYAKRIR